MNATENPELGIMREEKAEDRVTLLLCSLFITRYFKLKSSKQMILTQEKAWLFHNTCCEDYKQYL